MKKKLAFFAKTLGVGGIERAIINYVNSIDKNKYQVTLFLEKKEGIYLNDVSPDVEIIDYNINQNKIVIIRKIMNALKLLTFSIKYHNKFYFSANFATSIKSGAILAKRFSKNNAIWFHGEYWENSEDAEKFLKYIKADKYQKVVFVSNKIKELYLSVRPNTKQKLYVLNNIMDYKKVIEKSNEPVSIVKSKKILLNVGRHEEKDKKLTLLLNCVKRLVDESYDFELWMIGGGPDTKLYEDKIKELAIEKHVKLLGTKDNVFPYYKLSDVVVLSSIREGNPVVFLEAKILNKPVISTDVSDAKTELKGFGIVTPFDEKKFYLGIKKFLDEGYEIKNKFNPQKYNENILQKLYQVVEDRWKNG